MYVHKILHIQPFLCKKKHMMRWDSCGNFLFSCGNEKATRSLTKFCGGRAGTRTLDPLIKSQLLYQLSYAPGVRLRHCRINIFLLWSIIDIFSMIARLFVADKRIEFQVSIPMQSCIYV